MSRYEQLSVLVVDDDINLRTYMTTLLKSVGVKHIHIAAGKDDSDEIIGNHRIDGVFLDLVLQSESGLALGREFQEMDIPVIYCSGSTDEFNVNQMLEVGWVLTKPIRVGGIKRGLEQFLCHQQRCNDNTCTVRTL